jgi:hypothetical protein
VAGPAAELSALIGEYDAKWSALDIAGVADLWERNSPQPVYIGDEYAIPLIAPTNSTGTGPGWPDA